MNTWFAFLVMKKHPSPHDFVSFYAYTYFRKLFLYLFKPEWKEKGNNPVAVKKWVTKHSNLSTVFYAVDQTQHKTSSIHQQTKLAGFPELS